jgi:hypothetical protein
LPFCSDLYLSLVNLEPEGDALFPVFESLFAFKEIIETHPAFEVQHHTRRTAQ